MNRDGIELTDELAAFLDDLRDSQIDFGIGWSVECGGWYARIGRRADGAAAEETHRGLGQAVDWLCLKALERYPDSEFARHYAPSAPGDA
jgi:hypothetical protein